MKEKFKELIRVYRVNNWYYYLGFILIGFSLVSSINWNLILLLFWGAGILAYAYSLNDFCDFSFQSRKLYFLYPLILSFPILHFLTLTQVLLSFIFLLVVTTYSVPPLRFKSRPFISSFCNAFGFSILFLMGYSISFPDMRALAFFVLFLFFNFVAQFIHEILHLKEDKKNGDITTAVFLGTRRVKKLIYICLVSSFFVNIYLFIENIINWVLFLVTTFFIFFHLYEVHRKKIDAKLRKRYRISGMILGIIYFLSFLKF
jgi:4-hydroxybenzoate polyprenyltransferase